MDIVNKDKGLESIKNIKMRAEEEYNTTRPKVNHSVSPNLFRVYKGEDEAVMRNVVKELYGREYIREFKKSDDERFLLSSITKKEQIVEIYTAINEVPGTAGLKHKADGKPAPRRVWACYKDTADNSTLYYIVLVDYPLTVTDEKLKMIDIKYPNHIIIPQEGVF